MVEQGSKTRSGVTEQEAKEFQGFFVLGFVVFVGIAVVAHILVWMWRPWLSAESAELLDGLQPIVQSALTMLS